MSARLASQSGLARCKLPQGVLATVAQLLFANGEKGFAKPDFSDFTGMYQDIGRSIPVTAVEQPVALFEGVGSPVVVTTRVNLLLATETLATQAVTVGAGGYVLKFSGAGSVTLSGAATGVKSAGVTSITCTAGTLTLTVSSSVTKAYLYAAADSHYPYQAVRTALDYDTITTPAYAYQLDPAKLGKVTIDGNGAHYLTLNGVNQSYVTPSIDFSGTDKMTVIVGFTKTSDAAIANLVDLGVTPGAAGTFSIQAPGDAGAPNLRIGLSGSEGQAAWRATTYTAPSDIVLSVLFDIAGYDRITEIVPLVNGLTPTLTAAGRGSSGSGNFAAGPVYIGGGPGVYFTGKIYSIFVVDRVLTPTKLAFVTELTRFKTVAAVPPPAGIAVHRDLAVNAVNIYMPSNAGVTDEFIKYRLFHHVSAIADVWTIAGVWESKWDKFGNFVQGKELIIAGTELFCALQENGALDFMGGYAHGNEAKTTAPTLSLDGVNIDLATGPSTWYYGASATFTQATRLYRHGSALGTALASRTLSLVFSGQDIIATQQIKGLTNWTMTTGYLAMMAPHRYESFVYGVSEDTYSAQISGTAVDNVRGIPIDCSAQSNTSDNAQTIPRITRMTLSGTYGISFEVELQSTNDAALKDVMLLQKNNYVYNKAYIGFISGYSSLYNLTNETVFNTTTRYRISRS